MTDSRSIFSQNGTVEMHVAFWQTAPVSSPSQDLPASPRPGSFPRPGPSLWGLLLWRGAAWPGALAAKSKSQSAAFWEEGGGHGWSLCSLAMIKVRLVRSLSFHCLLPFPNQMAALCIRLGLI